MNELLTHIEAANYLNMSPRKLADLKKRGLVPFIQDHRWVRYLRTALDQWKLTGPLTVNAGANHGEHKTG